MKNLFDALCGLSASPFVISLCVIVLGLLLWTSYTDKKRGLK